MAVQHTSTLTPQSKSSSEHQGSDKDTDTSTAAIKTMKLYSNIDRIENELKCLGYAPSSPLKQEILSAFDSMHYKGDAAIQAALDVHVHVREGGGEVSDSLKILDVGSGFGGPARYMASSKGSHKVLALELQGDVHKKAVELTERCGLLLDSMHCGSDVDVDVDVDVNGDCVKKAGVRHVHGDILNDVRSIEGAGSYDLLTSWLVFLHVSEKEKLWKKCAEAVKPGGTIFIEDFYKRSEFTSEERTILSRDVFCECNALHSKEGYIRALEEAGFENVTFVDMTEEWSSFVNDRKRRFIEGKDAYVGRHCLNAYQSLLYFYDAMTTLFGGPGLGGVRIYGTRCS